ncbi:MAG TPA: adenylosuccinate synthetase, partial [Polyangiaceae bacterium]|nr:adenylosuccinate synthetase [Polyangiaceae bacterium]
LDVLSGLSTLRLCVAYQNAHVKTDEFPVDDLADVVPVYEEVQGWSQDISSARSLEDLPQPARDYLDKIQRALGIPLCLVGVGAGRAATLVLQDPFEA